MISKEDLRDAESAAREDAYGEARALFVHLAPSIGRALLTGRITGLAKGTALFLGAQTTAELLYRLADDIVAEGVAESRSACAAKIIKAAAKRGGRVGKS